MPDTDPYLWRPIWYTSHKRSSLAMRAMKMIRILVEHSIGVNRPIIWVGHSKGGLYIKQIIVNAHECNAYWLWKSSRAVLFYSGNRSDNTYDEIEEQIEIHLQNKT